MLRKTFEVQRLAGWISAETHVDVAGSRTDSTGDRLDFLSHVRMLTAAGPDAYDILEGARNLIDSGWVDLVVVRWMRDELGLMWIELVRRWPGGSTQVPPWRLWMSAAGPRR